jgi:hypothetical protein
MDEYEQKYDEGQHTLESHGERMIANKAFDHRICQCPQIMCKCDGTDCHCFDYMCKNKMRKTDDGIDCSKHCECYVSSSTRCNTFKTGGSCLSGAPYLNDDVKDNNQDFSDSNVVRRLEETTRIVYNTKRIKPQDLGHEWSIGFKVYDSKTASNHLYGYGRFCTCIADVTIPDDALVGSFIDDFGNTVYATTAANITNKRKLTANVLRQLINESFVLKPEIVEELPKTNSLKDIEKYKFTDEELKDIQTVFAEYKHD